MPDWSLIGNQETKIEAVGMDLVTTEMTLVTSSGSAHTKGAYSELIASTNFDYAGLILNIRSQSTTDTAIYDIAVGAAASEEVVVKDMYISTYGNNQDATSITLPIHIPKGSRVSVRSQSDQTNSASRVGGHGYSASFLSPSPLGKIVSYGVDLAASKGQVVDPGAVVDTKGSYVELTASTAEDLKGITLVVGDNINSAAGNDTWLIDLAVGAGGSEEVIIPDICVKSSPDENILPMIQQFPINIPKGSRVAVRCQCSDTDATDRIIDIAIIGGV